MIIGKNVYFIDTKDRCVKCGVVITDTISQSGYEVYIINDGDNVRHSVDLAMVFDREDLALNKLDHVLKIKDEMESLQKDTDAKLDAMREDLIGKPEFKEVADALFK